MKLSLLELDAGATGAMDFMRSQPSSYEVLVPVPEMPRLDRLCTNGRRAQSVAKYSEASASLIAEQKVEGQILGLGVQLVQDE